MMMVQMRFLLGRQQLSRYASFVPMSTVRTLVMETGSMNTFVNQTRVFGMAAVGASSTLSLLLYMLYKKPIKVG